ncbi:hypothetical protein BCR34DRAFT_319181 [Clohesyomyces aquaticus]|uniref:Integral membrane protein n=1 Tax=Clohesyomyces aquaticus TaxID=1231657 RepID=A0A1Y1ZN42_9PLEO|nr:hypothetical protein BCR34DRAFT_319181 [Clohesyomyces aquaticus]
MHNSVQCFVTAYALGLLSSTGPRLIKVLLLLGKGRLEIRAAWLQFISVLRQATALHRFPTFCGVLVGGSTFLQTPIRQLILLLLRAPITLFSTFDRETTQRAARFMAALLSAALSFQLLNSGTSKASVSGVSGLSTLPSHLNICKPGPFDEPPELPIQDVDGSSPRTSSIPRSDFAGRTMDLTLFAVIRALDVVVSGIWRQAGLFKRPSKLKIISRHTPTLLFCLSSATIMHAWFYIPSRLPQTYNRWISAAAELDHRLLLALRHARYGTFVYGKNTGMAPLLGSMCRDYGLPEVRGDPAQTIPIPCELVHMGRGKSCEKHAFLRFCRGWTFAAKMYAPLQFFVLMRSARTRRRQGKPALNSAVILRAASDMTRSSAFLGTFVALFYYGVCLSRTRLGPKLFSSKAVTPQMWDSGLCVLFGSLLCGSSILIEQPRKRLEVVFFVLPRAAATWFPRRYLRQDRWKEHLAFALSAAIVITAAQEDPSRVHGVLGTVLHRIFTSN